MTRLAKKHETAKKYVPAPVLHTTKGATVGILSYGSTEAAIEEARHNLEAEHGIKSDFMRVRATPFTAEVDEFIAKHDQIFVVEMNRDGQMYQILLTEYPQYAMKFKSVAFSDGLPAAAKWIREGVLAKYQKPATSKKPVSGKKAASKKPAAKKTSKPAAKKTAAKPASKSKAKKK